MGMLDRIKSRVGWCRIATLIVGTLILIIGLYSHFQSWWIKEEITIYYKKYLNITRYKLCGVDDALEKCPRISMERYFVAMISITFPISLLSFCVYILLNQTRQIIKLVDIGYHVVAGVLLAIAGVVYIISANQIEALVKTDKVNLVDTTQETDLKYKTLDKLVAGGITVIQAALYGVTALLIYLGN